MLGAIFVLAALVTSSTSLAALTRQLNDTTYYSPDAVESWVTEERSLVSCVTPFTYFGLGELTPESLLAELSRFLMTDDVFSEEFLPYVMIRGALTDDVETMISDKWQSKLLPSAGCENLPSGPYFLHPDNSVTRAYRLYSDPQMAFVSSATPESNSSFVSVTGTAQEGINGGVSVAVPSRLYFPRPSPERPLEGKRLAVKDIFDLKGTVTGAGSRSYFALQKVAEKNAASLQKLIDLGAVVVGKAKTTFFALGESPTADYVDQLAPFNPRGEGYQSPQGSSCGTGAAIAAYDWLDFGTGSDTGGSVRLPSQQNGLFGMRVTNASLPLDGIVPISPEFDTPGLLTRDSALLRDAYKGWYSGKEDVSFPKRIIMPTEFWPTVDNVSMATYDQFVVGMASFLNATVDSVNTNDSFITYTGAAEGIQSFLGDSYSKVTKYDQVNRAVKPFVADYEAAFGESPFFNPVPRNEWEYGYTVTEDDYRSAVGKVVEYGKWYRSEIVPSCDDSLVVYPIGPGEEDYRDIYAEPPARFGASYVATLQAVYAGVPDYTIPIGERTYFSRISQRNETLPITIGMIAAAGCDHMLADLVVNMGESSTVPGLNWGVKTGKSIY